MLNSGAHAASAHSASLPLPKLAKAWIGTDLADLSKKIGKGCRAAVAELGSDACMSLKLSRAEHANWNDTVVLEGPFGEIECADGARLIRSLTGIDIGSAARGDSALWLWMQAAVAGRLANTPFHGVERIALGSLASRDELADIELGIHSAQHAFSVPARASASTWLQFMASTGWTKDAADLAALQDLAIDPRVLLAEHRLPAGAIERIGAGTVIVPDAPRFNCDGEGTLRIAGVTIQVLYQAPAALTIRHLEGSVNAEDFNEDEYDEPSGDDAGSDGGPSDAEASSSALSADVLRGYPVTLEFELGRLQMKLGDLATLGVGAILSVAEGSPSAIAIVAGGKKLGRGEIVDIGGQLGIRITHWERR